MLEPSSPGAPTPADVLKRIRLSDPPAPAVETIRRATTWKQLVQDYRPVPESLEWRLSSMQWVRNGVAPFVDSGVPFLATSDGRLSVDAAAILFANCCESEPPEGPIQVLELGAGTGLFAHYFLDEFRRLCGLASRDYYDRLTYHVTDGSPRTIEQWLEKGIFEEHAAHVILSAADAATAGFPAPLRAVICNYVLDILPMAYLRKTTEGWQLLCARTWITDNAPLLRQYTALSFDEIRDAAASDDPTYLERLLPLLPLFECEADYIPFSLDELPALEELDGVPAGATLVYNYGAIGCLESLENALEPAGFLLVNDYAPSQQEALIAPAPGQRFGGTTAAGLNFPLLDHRWGRRGFRVVEPEGDAGRHLHCRLVQREDLPECCRVFETRFAADRWQQAEVPVMKAREYGQEGRLREALNCYRATLELNPRNWRLAGEAAEFVLTMLGDYATALELARAGVEMNPWYSPSLWNILGDSLAGLGRFGDAHECYLHARRISAMDVQTSLRLAESWLRLGNPAKSLEEVARGLANDSNSVFRQGLMEKQQQALAALAMRWNAERATAERRK